MASYAVTTFSLSVLHHTCIAVIREDLGGASADMQEIAGGMDRLPNAFYDALSDRIHLGGEVCALAQDEDSVTVHYKTEAGRFTAVGDYAVCAIPFSVLRYV